MPFSYLSGSTNIVMAIAGPDRWRIYQRLQELEIPCHCASGQPLQIQVSHGIAAIQLWSVTRQLNAPRQELIRWLEDCWQLS